MPPVIDAASAWIRRHLTWSNSREAWQQRLAAAALIGVTAFVYWITVELNLPLPWQLLVWGGVVVAWGIFARRGWTRLFGPVLFYDLVRTARRSRYFWLRLFYALILFFSLFSVWLSYRESNPSGDIPYREMTKMAGTFFFVLISVQFLVVGLLTPAYAAGAIAEEKERKTLEFILATDLRNREIVLSKQVSRLANLALLVLTGLPILSFVQLFGGVDPDLVLSGFAATGLTMASITSLAILLSVYSKKSRDAIVLTYLTVVSYLALSAFMMLEKVVPGGLGSTSLIPWTEGILTIDDVVDGTNAGNLIVAWFTIVFNLERGIPLATTLPIQLRNYAIFHGLVIVVCTSWAIVRIRAVALKQTYGKPHKQARIDRWWGRPRIGLRPMVWKEVYAERGLSLNLFGRITILLLVAASFVAPVWMGVDRVLEFLEGGGNFSGWNWFTQGMNAWVRIAGTGVGCLMLLGVAVRASGSMSIERDKQTLDSLLTSPLRATEILYAKWLGSILSIRWAWAWLALIWGLGVVSGGLHFVAVPILPIAWLILAAFLGVLGLWFSLVCRTTLRANVWTLIATAALGAGHWLPWFFCCFPLQLVGAGPNSGMEHVAYFQLYGFTPPFTLGWLAFFSEDFDHANEWHSPLEYTVDAVVGLFCWALAAWVLWLIVNRRFRVMAGRVPYIRRRPMPVPAKNVPAAEPIAEVIPVEE
jgi:ABC-type transport system involved in multi-copper enzyme maturation permease subunit